MSAHELMPIIIILNWIITAAVIVGVILVFNYLKCQISSKERPKLQSFKKQLTSKIN